MDRFREEMLHQFETEKGDEAETFQRALGIARDLGFEYCAYGIQAPLPVSRRIVAMYNNYPERWREEYSQNKYLEVDPTVKHAHRSSTPLLWSAPFFAGVTDLWEGARAHGLCHGWAMPSRDSSGAVGLLTFARRSEPISESELRHKEADMILAAHVVHCAMARRWLPRVVNEVSEMLTARERETLLWTAEGKTSSEIGTILGVAERTVNFHLNNTVRKLKAINKTQAVVKAVLLGLLF